ncbi:hypothetical protein [Amycolatopsis pithecellobii]|uniref:Uncharacterized protein n=1 Tax=Amycolatopsis pithecellobii TaxID=664692 RepID=A0A6N7Z8U0_9PSEU|nr:hypothetical protein [Amycolatopsis pithecellobii]MTD58150.1 hypothetical protein [Amycolatopsis pithecellobii]
MSMPVSRAADHAPIVVEHDDGWAQPRVEILDTKRRPLRVWLYRFVRELAWPVAEQEPHRTDTEAMRGCQQELAHRSHLRRQMHALEGWWAGLPPYGYRTRTHRVCDDSGFTRRLRRLVPDTSRAPIVPLIFEWFLDGHGPSAIAARLATDPDRYPPPVVGGRSRSWTLRIARGVLTIPSTSDSSSRPHRGGPVTRGVASDSTRSTSTSLCHPFVIGSPCTGHGGLDLALAALGSGRLVWCADPDPYVRQVIAARWHDVPNLGDLRRVDWTHVEPVDVLTADLAADYPPLEHWRAA